MTDTEFANLLVDMVAMQETIRGDRQPTGPLPGAESAEIQGAFPRPKLS